MNEIVVKLGDLTESLLGLISFDLHYVISITAQTKDKEIWKFSNFRQNIKSNTCYIRVHNYLWKIYANRAELLIWDCDAIQRLHKSNDGGRECIERQRRYYQLFNEDFIAQDKNQSRFSSDHLRFTWYDHFRDNGRKCFPIAAHCFDSVKLPFILL